MVWSLVRSLLPYVLNCFKKINHKEGMRATYGNLAMYYENLNTDKALSYVLLSQELRKGEVHAFDGSLIHTLQVACATDSFEAI